MSMPTEPETYLTWSDDGIHVQCERPECRHDGMFWMSGTLPYKLTGDEAQHEIGAHVATHMPTDSSAL